MDVNAVFYTQQTKPESAGIANLLTAVRGSDKISKKVTADFLDILAALNIKHDEHVEKALGGETGINDNNTLNGFGADRESKDNAISIAELLGASQDIKDDINHLAEILDLSLEDQIALTVALNQKAFAKLTQADPNAENLHQLILDEKAVDKDFAKALNDIMTAEDMMAVINRAASFSALQNADLKNLTPFELSQLQAQLDQNQANYPQVSDMQALIIKIVPQVAAGGAVLTALPSSITSEVGAFQGARAQMNGLAQRLNGLNIGDNPNDISELDLLLRALSGKEAANKSAQPASALMQMAKSTMWSNQTITDTAIIAPNLMQDSLMVQSLESFEHYMEEFAPHIKGVNALSTATNAITHAQTAHQANPATQMVAVTLQKMAADAQNRTFNIHLDPPELGRVDVKMTFGKDKSVKAVLTIEKPETFVMLQRDAQSLERSLGITGLDADGGLSFELAQDEQNFNQDGRHDGSRNKASSGQANGDQDMEIIETTMTWHVDPETGHMRYSIWV